jgi:hypothetical protein
MLAAVFLATLALACEGDGEGKTAGSPAADANEGETASSPTADLTVEEVYALFTEAITRPGHVYHAVVETDQEGGPSSYEGTIEHWVDVEGDLARQESAMTFGDGNTIRAQGIVAGGARYRPASEGQPAGKVEASKCHGASAAVSSVIGCPGPTEESTRTAETGRYEGQDAIVIVTTGTSYGSDEAFTFTSKLYLDSDTFLPIAREQTGTVDYGEVEPTRGLSRYQNDFVPADSLPDDFFDPASTGYVERDPEEPLRTGDPGITVYWLGKDYEGSGGLPALTLAIAYIPPRLLPGPRLSLEYKIAEEESVTPAIALEEWGAEEWDEFLAQSRGGNWWEWPCREEKELMIDGRRAVVHMGFDDGPDTVPAIVPTGSTDVICPQRPYDHFITHIYLESTVVTMSAGQMCTSEGCVDSPYDTLEGIEAIVRALKPRQ